VLLQAQLRGRSSSAGRRRARAALPWNKNNHITRNIVDNLLGHGMLSRMNLDTAARLFAELGNRTRLEILLLLIKAGPKGLSVGEIQRRAELPASTLAFHLRGLVGAGIVEQEKQGRTVQCRPCLAVLDAAAAFLRKECCVGFADERERRREVA
jgi:DNA-binding transcriptional ArsR family regulator